MAADFVERIGARIRQRREALGMTRPDVIAKMTGKVNENQLYRWEKGLHQPNPDTLAELAEILQCDVADFMAPEPDKTSTPDLVETLNGGGETEIARLAREVAELRQAVESQGEMIADRAAAKVVAVIETLRAEGRLTPEQDAERPPRRDDKDEEEDTGSDPTGPQP